MVVQWEVSFLRVETSPGDHIRDSLFANGYMQVPVIVLIQAIDPATRAGYTLRKEELDTIKLVDYYSPTTQLSAPWTYSGQENEFHHALPSTASNETPQTDGSSPTAALQKQTWWVSTSRVEHKNIGASIQAPDRTVYHTGGGGPGGFDSHVTISGIAPIHYNMSNVGFDREDTANGKTTNGVHTFDQDNYYLSSKVYRFRKVQMTGGYFSGPPPVEYSYVRVSKQFLNIMEQTYLHYLWPIGSQQTKQVGHQNATANITVNQRHGALCLTRLTLNGSKLYGDIGAGFNGRFTIWDEYGNWGKFGAGSKDYYNLITVSAHNSLLDEEFSPSEKCTPISPEEAASLEPGN